METDNLFLVYINPIGKGSDNLFQYEFFFSENPETVWGEDWNVACPSACGNLLPDSTTYSHIEILKTEIPLFCIQQNSCFSLQDCIDGLVCLGAEDISEYQNYPEPIRLVFHFEEKYDSVIEKLKIRDNFFESHNNLN